MQEKDIREKLNQELDEMAPDVLNKILAQPMEPVKSEKELFGKNKPLFKEKKKLGNYFWAPIVTTAVAACILIAILIIQPWSLTTTPHANTAFNIVIDVNPSISIHVKNDGTVDKVEAENKDAQSIVKDVNKKINKRTTYDRTIKLVIKQLKKEGYLEKEKSAMLVSVISDDKEAVKETVKEIQDTTKEYKEKKGIKCATVYQNCQVDDKILKVAEKNKISVGKAAFCMKIAEKEKVDVDNICDKNIYTLIKEAEKTGSDIFEQDMDEYVISGELGGKIDFETEGVTGESENISTESESVINESESAAYEETSTVVESQSVEAMSNNFPTEQEVATTPASMAN